MWYNIVIMSVEAVAADVLAGRQEFVLEMVRTGAIGDIVHKAGYVSGWQEDGAFGNEDVAQVTALRAYQHAEQLDETLGDPVGYVYRIAHNEMIDAARRRSRRPQPDSLASRTLNAPETLPGPAPDVLPPTADHATDVDNRLVVDGLLSELSEEHRTAIICVHLRGLSVAEAAAELGVAPGTVKSRVHYGMHQLRKTLQGQGVRSFGDF